MKTPKQYVEEIAAREHGDLTGLYDTVSVNGSLEAFRIFLSEMRKHWKGNNLVAKSEYETIDWAIDELIEEIDCSE